MTDADQQHPNPEALRDYVQSAALVMRELIGFHKYGWHKDRPRVGCPICLFSGAMEVQNHGD